MSRKENSSFPMLIFAITLVAYVATQLSQIPLTVQLAFDQIPTSSFGRALFRCTYGSVTIYGVVLSEGVEGGTVAYFDAYGRTIERPADIPLTAENCTMIQGGHPPSPPSPPTPPPTYQANYSLCQSNLAFDGTGRVGADNPNCAKYFPPKPAPPSPTLPSVPSSTLLAPSTSTAVSTSSGS